MYPVCWVQSGLKCIAAIRVITICVQGVHRQAVLMPVEGERRTQLACLAHARNLPRPCAWHGMKKCTAVHPNNIAGRCTHPRSGWQMQWALFYIRPECLDPQPLQQPESQAPRVQGGIMATGMGTGKPGHHHALQAWISIKQPWSLTVLHLGSRVQRSSAHRLEAPDLRQNAWSSTPPVMQPSSLGMAVKPVSAGRGVHLQVGKCEQHDICRTIAHNITP